MDIRVNGPGAEVLAEEAIGAIFGDDISTGPLRRNGQVWKAPTKLMSEARNQARVGVLFNVLLTNPPPLGQFDPAATPVVSHHITLHLVNILANGKLVGQAIRMGEDSQRTLAKWERAVARL